MPNVGKKYDVKNVSNGYATNFLIPHKLARYATEEAVRTAEHMREEREASARVSKEKQAAVLAGLNKRRIEIVAKASETGGLFAGIGADAIAQSLNKEFGLALGEEQIELAKPIKETGEHEVAISAAGAHAKIMVVVKAT